MFALTSSVVLFVWLFSCHGTPASQEEIIAKSVTNNSSSSCQHFNPCLHRGRCSRDDAGRYNCLCTPEYRGSRCQLVEYCTPNPCVNGVCSQRRDGFSCECNAGYVGRLCDFPDQCGGVTCTNGGYCVNRNGTAKCQCLSPYVGRRCENICLANTNCWRKGTGCVLPPNGSPSCECSTYVPNGLTVCIMEEDIENECKTMSNPCNGGQCYDTRFGFHCSCPSGRTGKRCEDPNPCADSPCRNSGTCSMVGDSYTCTCRPSYQGKHCEIYKEPCSVECNATSFVVSCNKDYLPVKVYSQILWTRQPEPVSKCTCQFYHWSSGHNRYRRRRRPCVIPYEGCGTKMQMFNNTTIYDNFLQLNKDALDRSQVEEPDFLITRRRGDFKNEKYHYGSHQYYE